MSKRIHNLTIAQRIEHHRVIRGECWEVDLDADKAYPQLNVGGQKKSIHRLSYEAYKAPIPPGLLVLHKCDNPRCHRPDHLFLGTHADNNRDAVLKGRRKGRGAMECDGVMRALAMVLSQQEIAECYGVTQTPISCALRRAGLARGKTTSFGKDKSWNKRSRP